MATDGIAINVSDNTEQISVVVVQNNDNSVEYSPDEGSPYYVGAELDVERVSNGVKVTATDKHGTTSATVFDGEKGERGEKGDKGDKGEQGEQGTSGFDAYTEADALHLLSYGLESRPVFCNTTEGWNAQPTLVSVEGAVYIYSDYDEIDGTPLAGIKVGDGLAYVVDLPFVDAKMQSHMANDDIHITPSERAFWNNKNRGYVNGENLILTIN